MRVLVYPHAMEMGGSQLNAVEVAAAVRARGHEVVVYADDGDLVPYARERGLEVVRRRRSPFVPAPERVVELRKLVRDRGIDVVHGYEWPPILEGFAALSGLRSAGSGPVLVGTILSMGVADFLPSSSHLFVGTERIRRAVAGTRIGPVHLMEPPVDVHFNNPGQGGGRDVTGAPRAAHRIVVVSRLAHELKLEGIVTAVRAVGSLARAGRSVELVVVGDGPARPEVERAVDEVHRELGRPVVHLTGSLPDPRAAYDSADVCLAMGGSALRAMAFAKPVVVQGEGGFFRTLTPDSVDTFLEQGWYGRDTLGPGEAVQALCRALEPLLDDSARIEELGAFGRALVEHRFSLEAAAAKVESVYQQARAQRAPVWSDAWISSVRLGRYKVRTRWEALQGRARRDDFNARPI